MGWIVLCGVVMLILAGYLKPTKDGWSFAQKRWMNFFRIVSIVIAVGLFVWALLMMFI